MSAIGLADVHAAAERLAGVAHRTPALSSRTLAQLTGAASVHLKAENLQRVGAFKFRGAYNALAAQPGASDVCAVSSGNHAQAVALSARLLGRRATILMPHDAPPSKVAATEGYGATIIRYDRYAEDREDLLSDMAAEHGMVPVHPYDDPLIMAGQGTAALELLEQAGPLDVLLVPVGGGGLIAGCSVVAADAGVRVIGVEPEAGDDAKRSLEAGERVSVGVPRTIADGLQLAMPGERTFATFAPRTEAIVTVSDDELVAAMAWAFERLRLVLEPSAATVVAALLARDRIPGGLRAARLGAILSGGNVSLDRFAALTAPPGEPGDKRME